MKTYYRGENKIQADPLSELQRPPPAGQSPHSLHGCGIGWKSMRGMHKFIAGMFAPLRVLYATFTQMPKSWSRSQWPICFSSWSRPGCIIPLTIPAPLRPALAYPSVFAFWCFEVLALKNALLWGPTAFGKNYWHFFVASRLPRHLRHGMPRYGSRD